MRSMVMATSAISTLVVWTLLGPLSSPAHGATAGADPAETTTSSPSESDSLRNAFEQMWRNARPVAALRYGFGDIDRDGFGGELAPVGVLEVQLGFQAKEDYAGQATLVHQSTSFAHVSNMASRLASDTPSGSEVGTDMWRFGVGFGDGYGYRFAEDRRRLVLQNSGTIGWHTFDLDGAAASSLSPADAALLEQFTSHTRYGDSWESAVEFGFGETMTLHAGYERAAVFPSFKVWYALLSALIDRGALVASDLFVDKIAKTSPYAAPVVRFVLDGALQYGFYELRKDDVNWPFDTDAPLVTDAFKLGVMARF